MHVSAGRSGSGRAPHAPRSMFDSDIYTIWRIMRAGIDDPTITRFTQSSENQTNTQTLNTTVKSRVASTHCTPASPAASTRIELRLKKKNNEQVGLRCEQVAMLYKYAFECDLWNANGRVWILYLC